MTVTHRKRKLHSSEDDPTSPHSNSTGSGGMRYHCDSCKRDITNTIRVRCAECADFDLCIECFARGVEIGTHLNNHSYRLLDKYAFPLLEASWGADEEWLLLEAIDTFGLGNWADIADHVGNKTLEECRDHYIRFYIDSPTFPLPYLDEELDENVVAEVRKKRQQSPGRRAAPVIPPFKAKVAPSQPANHEIQGYMPGRLEFDYEPENEAEQVVKDMIFNDDDTPTDIDLKVAVLDIYNSRLDVRKERKDFIFDRNIIEFRKLQNLEKKRARDEKDVYQKYKAFARLMLRDDYESFVKGLLKEKMLRQRIAQLQEYRRNGIRTLKEGEIYETEKRQRIAQHGGSLGVRTSASTTLSATNTRNVVGTRFSASERSSPNSSLSNTPSQYNKIRDTKMASATAPIPLDLNGCDGIDQLTPSEQSLCSNLRLYPRAYMAIKQVIIRESEKRGGLKRREARTLVRIDVNKLGKIYDFFVSKGWIKCT